MYWQLTHEDTYNGQLLDEGAGVAFVGNSNFVFSLNICPKDSHARTNLFRGGGVMSYTATASGKRVYAVAWEGLNPAGIWEYDLRTRRLRLLADGFSKPFVVSRVIEPKQFKLASFDGLRIPCYLYPPLGIFAQTNKEESWFRRMKYPAVIYVPPPSAAASRSFNARMQLLANLGFYVLAVNYRGCEGYGSKYANMSDPSVAAKDILAGYDMLSKNPSININRVFLLSDSGGYPMVSEVLATKPELWRAVSFEHPEAIGFRRFDPANLPPIFFATGDQDAARQRLQKFEMWAKSNSVSVTSVVYTNSGHITYRSDERKDKLDRVARFLISHL